MMPRACRLCLTALALFSLLHVAPPVARAGCAYYLVTSGDTGSVRKYNVDGSFVKDLVPPTLLLDSPQYMVVDDGVLYVVNYGSNRGNHSIQTFDLATGEHLGVFADGPELRNAAFMTLRPQNRLTVGSLNNSRILQYNLKNGRLLDDLVTQGAAPAPHGMLWRDDGRFLVSTTLGQTHRIMEFDPDGSYVRNLVTGSGLARPLNLQFSPDGAQVYVSNFYGRVLRFDAATGSPAGAFTNDDAGLFNPDGLCYGHDGELLIAFWGSHRVARFNATTGQRLGYLGTPENEPTRPNHVMYVAAPDPGDFDGNGRVDLRDHDAFVDCLAGPDSLPQPRQPRDTARCVAAFDGDCDEDVDLHDHRAFQRVFGN